MLVLATTGRRTGQPRRTCLIYGTSGGDFVLVASKGGADLDPHWNRSSTSIHRPADEAQDDEDPAGS